MKAYELEEYQAWEKLSIDLFGPMPDGRSILVAQDMVTRFPAAKIITKTDADHVIDVLEEFYANYGTPEVNRTDAIDHHSTQPSLSNFWRQKV